MSEAYTIEEHQHRLAAWAAGRAASVKGWISGAKLCAMPVPLPTFKEQEAVVKALSDGDALVESLEQLLTKKRHIKQGATQELLTGKKRLPGFEVKKGYKQTEVGVIPEDWRIASLAELPWL